MTKWGAADMKAIFVCLCSLDMEPCYWYASKLKGKPSNPIFGDEPTTTPIFMKLSYC